MFSPEPFQRRAVLASSVSLLTGLSGCASVFDESSEPETYRPPPLHAIELWNYYDEPKQIALVVERNGQIVHWKTYKLPKKSQDRIIAISDKEWIRCGRYEVSTRVQDGPQWATLDFRNVEPSGMANGKVQTIRLGVDFHPEGIDFRPVHLDDPMVRCEGAETGTQGTRD